MIVVADTSPISYLFLIGEIDLLPTLFGRVAVPRAVASELQHPAGPAPLVEWMVSPPGWLKVGDAGRIDPSPRLAALDAGEQAAISLAQHLDADLLIVDDRPAREAARSLGLSITGTLGVLEAGARRGLVDLPLAVERLCQTSFRVSTGLLRSLLERNP